MKVSLKTKNAEFLGAYSLLNPKLSKIEFGGTISVFSFVFGTESSLSDNWEFITSLIGAYYQSEFENEDNEFEQWNIYILFLVKELVSTQLKYKIENDKFSCRKIVQDKIVDVSDDRIHKFIEKHIINKDLNRFTFENQEVSDKSLNYVNNSEIYKLIEGNNLKTFGKGADKDGLENLYQQIVKEIKDEIQESRNTSI